MNAIPPNVYRFERVELEHVRKHRSVVVDVEQFTLIRGENKTGKTSILETVKDLAGQQRTLTAHVEDGVPTGVPCAKAFYAQVNGPGKIRITRTGAGRPVVHEFDGEDWHPRPAEWIRDLIDVRAANPAAMLEMKADDFIKAIIETIRLESYSRTAALEATGLLGFNLPTIPDHLHPLEELEIIGKAVSDARRATRSRAEEASAAATRAREKVPAQPPEAIGPELARCESRAQALADDIARAESEIASGEREALQKAQSERDKAVADAQNKLRELTTKLRGDHADEAARLRAECERAIAALAEAVSGKLEVATTATNAIIAEANSVRDEAEKVARAAAASGRDELAAQQAELGEGREHIAALRERELSLVKDRTLREQAAEARDEADKLHARVKELTESLEALARFKVELAGRIPIDGLAITFDEKGKRELSRHGRPLAQMSDAERASLAIEVSLLRLAPPDNGRPYVPLIIHDRAESLDAKTRAMLRKMAADANAQVLLAGVANSALEVVYGDEAIA